MFRLWRAGATVTGLLAQRTNHAAASRVGSGRARGAYVQEYKANCFLRLSLHDRKSRQVLIPSILKQTVISETLLWLDEFEHHCVPVSTGMLCPEMQTPFEAG